MSYKINSFITSDKVVASYEKRLSICLSSNGFSFSICSVNDELLSFGEVECNVAVPMSELIVTVKAAFNEMQVQPFGLKETELVVCSHQFVWIPQHLFEESRQRSYLEALCKVATGYGIYSDYNDVIKAWIVFSAENSVVSAFKIVCPGLKVRCQHGKMVNADTVGNSDLKSLMVVNVRDGKSDYAVFCNKKLQISNTFDCVNFDETLYHAVNLTKQFHLEDASMTVAVCGNIGREEFSRMRPFFPHLTLYNGRPMTLTVPEMQHIHLYRNALIFS